MKLRKFTEEGHNKYSLLYKKIRDSISNSNDNIEKGFSNTLKKEVEILQNDLSCSIEIPTGKNLKIQNFNTSYELGLYLNDLLSECNYKDIFLDQKMWDWITLFHFDTVFNSKMSGYSDHRYLLNDDWFVRYRHLIRTPWYAVYNYKKNSKLFLSKAPYIGSDYLEQYISHRISEFYLPSAEIAFKLYYDKEKDKPRPGYSKKYVRKKNKKTLVKASLGRLFDNINQFNQIYDLWEMTPMDVINLLPKEFDTLKELNGLNK